MLTQAEIKVVMDELEELEAWGAEAEIERKRLTDLVRAGHVFERRLPVRQRIFGIWDEVMQMEADLNARAAVNRDQGVEADVLLARDDVDVVFALWPTVVTEDGYAIVKGAARLDELYAQLRVSDDQAALDAFLERTEAVYVDNRETALALATPLQAFGGDR